MRLIDADALSAFVDDLRSALHKEQSKFKGMTDIEFDTRDYMLLNFQYAIDNAPTVSIYTFKEVEEIRQATIEQTRISCKCERPHGEWLEDSGNIACSNCHTIWLYRRTDYCPHCGADMRGGRE